ncbi:MAG: hypothetical protein DRJ97_02720 [Thermoprotei archaeon]|nr:MAG: hypothetical protein DRJ97_02720 [Thermoprotei archaeon]
MKVEEARFRSFDETELKGYLFTPDVGSPPHPTVCLCHGIPVSPRQPGDRGYAEVAERLCSVGVAAMTFNFRGTGESGGEFDLMAWPADLEAAIDYLYNHPTVDKERLGVAGFSGGAVAALYAASVDPRIKAIALCACPGDTSKIPLTALEETIRMARESGSLRGVEVPNSALKLKRDFEALNPVKFIRRVHPRPLLILHGSADELIAVEEARRLYEEALEPKQLIIVEGAPHKLRLHQGAMEALASWFKELWLK